MGARLRARRGFLLAFLVALLAELDLAFAGAGHERRDAADEERQQQHQPRAPAREPRPARAALQGGVRDGAHASAQSLAIAGAGDNPLNAASVP